MAERLARIQANIEWLLHFAVSRYVNGVNIPLPGKPQPVVEEEKKEVDMEVDEDDKLMAAVKKVFPS